MSDGRPSHAGASAGSRASPWARVASAAAAFVAALLVLWVGLPLLAPSYLVISGIAIFEYVAMLRLRGLPVRRTSLLVATLLTLPASLPAGAPIAAPFADAVPWRELLLGLYAFVLVALEVARPRRDSFAAVVHTLFGYLWIPWLLGYVLTLRYTPDPSLGVGYLALAVLAVVASDVGGWAFGSAFGRRPLAPELSPDKTLEGAIGGLALAVVVVTAAVQAMDLLLGLRIDVYHGPLFGLLVASASQLGDLFESLVKRWAGVKDAGIFLPGQGGVLDRIDSHLLAVPVAYFFVTLVVLP